MWRDPRVAELAREDRRGRQPDPLRVVAARQGAAPVGPDAHQVAVDGRILRCGRRWNRCCGARDEDAALTPGGLLQGGHAGRTRHGPDRLPPGRIARAFMDGVRFPLASCADLTYRQRRGVQGASVAGGRPAPLDECPVRRVPPAMRHVATGDRHREPVAVPPDPETVGLAPRGPRRDDRLHRFSTARRPVQGSGACPASCAATASRPAVPARPATPHGAGTCTPATPPCGTRSSCCASPTGGRTRGRSRSRRTRTH